MNNLHQDINNLEYPSRENLLKGMISSLTHEETQELLLKLMQQPQPLLTKSENLPSDPSSQSLQIFPPSKSQKTGANEDYPDEIKKETVQEAVKKNNNRGAARYIREKYKRDNKYQSLSEKSVREWRAHPRYNDKLQFDTAHKGRRKFRRISSPYLAQETELVNIINAKRALNELVTSDFMISEAKRLIANPQFKASPGWLSNFKRRWNVRRRIPTSIVQKLSIQYTQQVKNYLEEIRRLRYDQEQKKGIQLIIGNMDQTSLRFDMSRGWTYDFKGSKEVRIRTTSGNKLTFTALLAMLNDGTKLPPVFVFKSRTTISNALKNKYKDKALIYSNSTGWCVQNVLKDWLENIWLNLDLKENQKSLLILDNFSVHKMPFVHTMIKEGGGFHEYIPPGCTGLLQPLDTHINKSYKDYMRKLFDKWFADRGSKEENRTKAGNLRAPSADLVIEWALEAWENISEDLIEKSFKHCGKIFN